MASRRYRALERNIKRLTKAFTELDKRARTDHQHGLIAIGFRLLSHAEVESYIEDVATGCAVAAARAWKQKRTIARVLASLLVFQHDGEVSGDEDRPSERHKPKDIEEKINWAMKGFAKRVADNHGVQEKNLLALLVPLGCLPSDLSPTLTATLDAFGKERGEVAHKPYGTISVAPQLANEAARAVTIIQLLADVDDAVCGLR